MHHSEEFYLEKIEEIIEKFAVIQRKFVQDKQGVQAIIRFIEDFSGAPQSFSLDDPVIQKGRSAAQRVAAEMEEQLKELQKLRPPEVWTKFHETLTQSIKLQLDGYKEMSKVFESRNVIHIAAGQKLVNEGMSLLEAGYKPTPE